MAEIKSSLEIAMEKAAKLGEASQEEVTEWKYTPKGRRLAVEYLSGECNLMAELAKYDDTEKQHIAKGVQDVLLREIVLPKSKEAKNKNKRAMEGVGLVKKDKVALENIFTKMRRIFRHYEENGEGQRQQAYEMLKRDFELKLQQAAQTMGVSGVGVDVERHPQFQEEWRRLQVQLDSQYKSMINECKDEITAVS
jgi:hypothetical protein